MQAQAPADVFNEISILPNKDTLVTKRSNGTWWFGAHAGGTYFQGFGTLRTQPPLTSVSSFRGEEIAFSGGTGLGTFTGLVAEWVRPNDVFSASMMVTYDFIRTLEAKSDEQFDTSQNATFENYEHESEFTYVRVAPSLRYNLADFGLFLLGGPNIDIPVSSSGKILKRFENTGKITDVSNFAYEQNDENDPNYQGDYDLLNVSLGLHFGIGYDILLGDLAGMGRVRLTPFALGNVNYGVASGNLAGPQYSDVESNLHLADVRAGVQLKFAYDNISYDTLQFDPNYAPPINSIVEMRDEKGINFDGLIPVKTVDSKEIAYVELPEIEEQLKEDAVLNIQRPSNQQSDLSEARQTDLPEYELKLNDPKTFNFSTINQTAPNKAMRDYYDAIANYLRENPNVNIVLESHTDNTGTIAAKEDRSQQILNRAINYIMKDGGINRRRLLDRSLRDIEPVASNRTAEGRRQNRRIVLELVPAGSTER
ncbi:MAG: hypothetical protein Kapaf2KO_10190 [Candidatus Kapaibacteriales bacterium]